MSEEGLVTSLSQFLVCQSEDCHQPVSIYHIAHFKDSHFTLVNGKKVPHKSASFRDSIQFLNFSSVYRINHVLGRRFAEALRGLESSIETVVQSALLTSTAFRQLFNNADAAIYEYNYVCQIHQGVKMGRVDCFSADFCTAISTLNEKTLNKLYKELCGYSQEWQYLNLEFNYASGINSNHLEEFVGREIQYFVAYTEKANVNFDIKQYINIRGSSKEYFNDPYYYSPEFVTFLTQKYERNPAGETVFNLMEYYLNFWQYFFVVIDTNKNTSKYFYEEIGFYKEYETFAAEQKLEQSFLAFRMWRINRKVSTYFPSLKNPFFLQTFIYSFIQFLIEKKLFAPDQERNYDFKDYAAFLQDYVKFVVETKEQFSFTRYNEYFEFRKISQKLEQNLKKNKEIVYDKKFFLEYANSEFVENNKLGIKKYKKYQQRRSEQQQEKDRIFREETEKLKEVLAAEQKQYFYQIVFSSFIKEVSQPNSGYKINKESYLLYKQNLFATYDQSYIQTMQADYRQSLADTVDFEERKARNRAEQAQKEVVKEEINVDEEQIADLIKEEDRSEASSSEQEDEQVQNCPCCKGDPYECQQPDCKILGCCSACMLDD